MLKRQRLATTALLGVALLAVITGCDGDTEDAAYIGSTSARLRGHGLCNNSQTDASHGTCFFYFRIRVKGGTEITQKPAGSNCPTSSSPAGSIGIPNTETLLLECTWTELSPDTEYEFALCGGDGLSGAGYCKSWKSFSTTTYANPLTTATGVDLVQSAPKVNYFASDGLYYMSGSGKDVALHTSSDLIHWDLIANSPTFTNAKADGTRRPPWASDNPDTRNSKPDQPPVYISWWGTELYKIKPSSGAEKYVLVSSFDYDHDGETQAAIGLATSTSLTAGFTWLTSPIDWPAPGEQHIDPSIFVDADKSVWLLHAINGNSIGVVPLNKSNFARKSLGAGGGQTVVLNTSDHPKSYEFEGPRDGHPEDTYLTRKADNREEGPGLLKGPNGMYYLYYATGNSKFDTDPAYAYTLGFARSASLTSGYEKMPDVRIINNTAKWRAAGHGGIVPDKLGRLWYIFHSYSVDNIEDPTRTLAPSRYALAQQILWNPATQWFSFEDAAIRDDDIGIPSP